MKHRMLNRIARFTMMCSILLLVGNATSTFRCTIPISIIHVSLIFSKRVTRLAKAETFLMSCSDCYLLGIVGTVIDFHVAFVAAVE